MSLNRFTQYIPAFVDARGGKPYSIEFRTTEELIALKVVQRYIRDDFSHFAMSDEHLMAVSDDGFVHVVVGRIQYPKLVDLPPWDEWKFRAELPNGEKVILGNEVISSCGDVLTLKDGTKAKNLKWQK